VKEAAIRGSGNAFMAELSFPEKKAVRAEYPVVVQGHDGWDARVAAGVKDGRGQKRKEVMNMDDIRLFRLDNFR